MDLRRGPQSENGFEPNAVVNCTYVKRDMSGKSPKFTCAITPDDEVKVKYGATNGEVYGEVAATRLLWALGFSADHMYPVRVLCHDCPADPARAPDGHRDDVEFSPAAIERKMPGQVMETTEDSGWSWLELDQVNEAAAGAPRAQLDALKLLAVLIQHTDTKPAQQQLLCATEVLENDECARPLLMINDLGLTFGKANTFNRNEVGSVNFKEWSETPVWKDAAKCVGQLSKSSTGTLENPKISEAGRKFLADLLVQLTDTQLHDLFDVSRFALRSQVIARSSKLTVTTDQWVNAFKSKRDAIVKQSCPP